MVPSPSPGSTSPPYNKRQGYATAAIEWLAETYGKVVNESLTDEGAKLWRSLKSNPRVNAALTTPAPRPDNPLLEGGDPLPTLSHMYRDCTKRICTDRGIGPSP